MTANGDAGLFGFQQHPRGLHTHSDYPPSRARRRFEWPPPTVLIELIFFVTRNGPPSDRYLAVLIQ